MIEGENLVVVGVGEFMEDHVGLHWGPVDEFVGMGDFDGFSFLGVVVIFLEPFFGGVVAGGGVGGAGVIHPDWCGLELRDL